MIDWIKRFNRHTFEILDRFKERGKTFKEWFGVDEHWYTPDRIDLEDGIVPKITVQSWQATREHTAPDKRIYRMLLLDGFAGHVSFFLIKYYLVYDIVLGFFPAHATHLLQPLDVGVFQPMKKAHMSLMQSKMLGGGATFSRADFVFGLNEMINTAFTERHISIGYRYTGLYPYNPELVLLHLRKGSEGQDEPTDAALTVIPKNQELGRAIRAA